MRAGNERWNPGASKGPRPLTTMLRQEATVDDTVAGRDAAEPDISGGTRDGSRRDPCPAERHASDGVHWIPAGRHRHLVRPRAGGRGGNSPRVKGWTVRGFSDLSGTRRPPGRRASRPRKGCARLFGGAGLPGFRAVYRGALRGLGWALRVRARRNAGINSRVQLTESALRDRPPGLTGRACVPVGTSFVNIHPALG
jgi:hypothetical protein